MTTLITGDWTTSLAAWALRLAMPKDVSRSERHKDWDSLPRLAAAETGVVAHAASVAGIIEATSIVLAEAFLYQ